MNFEISVAELCRQLAQPAASKRASLRKAGDFHAVYRSVLPANPKGRWQTFAVLPNEFLLLVDEFHGVKERPYALALQSEKPFEGGRRRFVSSDESGSVAVHPLADYDVEKNGNTLMLRQRLANGRFLLAITRETDAKARVLNGWAVEICSKGRIYHVMHSNRSRRLRPLGPIQTDAQFALVEWPADKEAAEIPPFGASFSALQAGQLRWGDGRQLSAEKPVDFCFHLGGTP